MNSRRNRVSLLKKYSLVKCLRPELLPVAACQSLGHLLPSSAQVRENRRYGHRELTDSVEAVTTMLARGFALGHEVHFSNSCLKTVVKPESIRQNKQDSSWYIGASLP